MGNKSGDSWLNAVKKAFRSPTNEDEKKKKRSSRRRTEDEEKKSGKKRWIFGRHLSAEKTIQHNAANSSAVSGEENLVRKHPKMEGEGEHKHALAVAMEIIRLTRPALLLKQDKAALFIQKIFRGYLARRALMALRGVVKLQAVIRGHNVRKRAKMTLQCIQSLVRVQSIVCDQRRRLSCEAATLDSKFTQSYRVSNPSDVGPTELEKIHALIHKAKQCSLKQSNTLANALSKQIWATEDEDSSRNTGYSWMRKDRNLCNQRDPIKTIEVDYMFNVKRLNIGLQSPRTPKTRPIPCYQQDAAESPCSRRMSMSDRSCPLPRPNYMAATASAIARVRPNSAPRYRQSSPSREVAKKRLYFHDHDFEDQSNYQRCRDKPCYATD